MGHAAQEVAGLASPDHIPESAPMVLVQPQGQQPLVLALDLDVGRTEGVRHCLQQRDSSGITSVAGGPANVSSPEGGCVSSVQHTVPALFLQVTQQGQSRRLLWSLRASGFLQSFSQPAIRNSEHSPGCWGPCLPGYEVA